MNCEKFHQQLDDYLDGQLAESEKLELEKHIDSCNECHLYYGQAALLQHQIKHLSVPEPQPGFEERLFAKLESNSKKTNGIHWFPASLGGAMAAMLLMWLTIFSQQQDSDNGLQQLTIEMGQAQTKIVQLVFNSPDSFNEATFTIELPENLELQGYPVNRMISWQSQLKKGRNSLALPLVSIGKVKGEVVARLSSGEQSKEFRMKVNMTYPRSGNLLLNRTSNNQV